MPPLRRFKSLFPAIASFVLLSFPAHGENVEVGATVGFGSVGAEDLTNTTFASFGAEFCALRKGSFAIFAEYTPSGDT